MVCFSTYWHSSKRYAFLPWHPLPFIVDHQSICHKVGQSIFILALVFMCSWFGKWGFPILFVILLKDLHPTSPLPWTIESTCWAIHKHLCPSPSWYLSLTIPSCQNFQCSIPFSPILQIVGGMCNGPTNGIFFFFVQQNQDCKN